MDLHQLELFAPLVARAPDYAVSVTPEVSQWLAEDCVVAVGASGGKDSVVTGLRLDEYLNEIGHRGPRVLIHADLGSVEWKDSLPACERLARAIGWELIVVKRPAGGMMERWQTRWQNNLSRYESLSLVKLLLPWSTPAMRFCTSELKTAPICAELTRRFPGQRILSATGVRHDESAARAKAPVAAIQPKLSARKCQGMNWNPIITWPTAAVFDYAAMRGERLHEAYTRYSSTRVSCAYCIMGSSNDLLASASCADNADIYRTMVDLEIESTFAFQGARWLGDVAPHLLTQERRTALAEAKERARRRNEIEARIPAHLLYSAGWPTVMPSYEEADLLAGVRVEVAKIIGFPVRYTTAEAVLERYQELMTERDARKAA